MVGVFSEEPKSYKMDRKSSNASKLKSLISHQLLRFFPPFSDDVLAEYITVLVCNGKNQNQARDDLEAFLGERSGEFVSWLWRRLKYERQSTAFISPEEKDKTSCSPLDTDEENYNRRNANCRDLQKEGSSGSDHLMGQDGDICCPSSRLSKSCDRLISVDQHPLPPKAARTVQSTGLKSKSAKGDSMMKVPSSLEQHQIENADNFEEPASLGRCAASSKGRHSAILGKCPASSVLYSHGDKPERLRMDYTADAPKRSLSPVPWVSSSPERKPRLSVWDRLGKPVHYASSRDPVSRRLKVHNSTPEGRAEENDNNAREHHVAKSISQVPSLSNIRIKRHFGELSSQNDTGTTVAGGTEDQSEDIRQACKRTEIQLEASEAVVSQVQDMKLRLRQFEIEMAKLRSKQTGMDKDGKTNLLTDSGVVKPTEEDVESRTIRVTNVHHKATKEALSMYFWKCGTVVNVAILADAIPAAQRSAYITFKSKESVDKALGLSGTTFYSRTIMVSRKGVMAADSAAAQYVAKRIQGHDFSTTIDATPNAFPVSRLQWRRESPTPIQNEFLASGHNQTQLESASASISEMGGNSK